MIVVPFCSLLLAVIAAHFVLGPVGWKIGSVISTVVYAGITGSFKVVFGAVFGFVYAPLVITGLHHMSNAIDLQLIADYGGTMLWPMIALSNIAQGSAVLGMIVLQRKNAEAQEVNVPACISCYLGVTEPAIFGINLKYVFPFVCGMIGSACAAVVCVATGTTANAIGVGGLPGDSFHTAGLHGQLCGLHGDCSSGAAGTYNGCRAKTPFRAGRRIRNGGIHSRRI